MVIWITLAILLLIISINDFLFFRIENEYVLSLLALYLIAYVFGTSDYNFFKAFKLSGGVFVIAWVLNRYNLIGGGDVKLLFPLLLFAENHIQAFLFGTSMGTLFLALLYVLFHKHIFFLRRKIIISLYTFRKNRNKSILLNFVLLSLGRINKKTVALKRYVVDVMKQEIPYGIALSCGGFWVIVEDLVVW